jgi:hypothetical protein
MNLKLFNKLNVVGKGGFGKVFFFILTLRFGKSNQKNKKKCLHLNKCLKLSLYFIYLEY